MREEENSLGLIWSKVRGKLVFILFSKSVMIQFENNSNCLRLQKENKNLKSLFIKEQKA